MEPTGSVPLSDIDRAWGRVALVVLHQLRHRPAHRILRALVVAHVAVLADREHGEVGGHVETHGVRQSAYVPRDRLVDLGLERAGEELVRRHVSDGVLTRVGAGARRRGGGPELARRLLYRGQRLLLVAADL